VLRAEEQCSSACKNV